MCAPPFPIFTYKKIQAFFLPRQTFKIQQLQLRFTTQRLGLRGVSQSVSAFRYGITTGGGLLADLRRTVVYVDAVRMK